MQALRLAALSSVLLALGFTTVALTTDDAPRQAPKDRGVVARTSPDGTPEARRGRILSASTPARDVAGEPVPGLTRYPGSVRAAYSERRADGLSVVRAGYLTQGSPAAVRDFYADLFRAEGWQLANVEYAGGEWYFLVARGGREAVVEVSSRGGGSLVRIEASRPVAQEGSASAGGSKR